MFFYFLKIIFKINTSKPFENIKKLIFNKKKLNLLKTWILFPNIEFLLWRINFFFFFQILIVKYCKLEKAL
jgi:hypothetical protein